MRYQSQFLHRHEVFMSVMELSSIINELEDAYEETRNEKVLKVLRRFKAVQDSAREDEIRWNESDFQEILRNPGLYPHSVVSWAQGYRDQEIS